ncbi:hypothetical protein [Halocalculus aciditolerans]|uniref:Uncharacterized protein n=1 Tax=Halocalculus aciditolerans TaxID=1383812 RepID=A0A830F330_9EURY|nr:hypothetical protein [Halocalculus aciditolerans]GGL57946.1 hypothetical protein GCM10009039_15180 [Halocalculus aciditolerans]
MGLETNTQVRELATVENASGDSVQPASDDFVHWTDTGRNVKDDPVHLGVRAPDRADVVTVHVADWDGSGTVTLHFCDEEFNPVTSRGASDNPDYESDGTTDVFIETSVASPYLKVDVEDTSGNENKPNVSVYAR